MPAIRASITSGQRRDDERARSITRTCSASSTSARSPRKRPTTIPQSNLLTGCLGTFQDPPLSQKHIDRLEIGDSVLTCSDGLWHYFTPRELGAIVHALPPREATEMLVGKARQRARGSGDNLSLALVRVEAAEPEPAALCRAALASSLPIAGEGAVLDEHR